MFLAIITLTVLIFSLIKGTLGDPHNCSFKDDCVAANAIGVYYDNFAGCCVCDCKPGWAYIDCSRLTKQNLLSVDYPKLGYSSQLTFDCRYAGTYKNATKRCQSFGDGWDIASLMSHDACKAAGVLAYSAFTDCWLGGTDVALPGTWVWQAGRYKGKAFFVNGTEVSGMYANWSTPPTDQQCNKHTKHWMAVVQFKQNFKDYYDECPGGPCSCEKFPICVMCERSPCVKKLDCVIANTKDVSGYYPCVCECYSGYSGNDCSINLVNSTTKPSPVPTTPSTTTLSTVPTIPTTTTPSPVPTIPTTTTLSPVPTMPSTTTLSTVPTIPSTSTLSTVPTMPSTTTLSPVPTMHNTSTLSPVPTTHSISTLSPVPTMHSFSALSPVPTMSMLLVITLLLSYSHVLSRLLL